MLAVPLAREAEGMSKVRDFMPMIWYGGTVRWLEFFLREGGLNKGKGKRLGWEMGSERAAYL